MNMMRSNHFFRLHALVERNTKNAAYFLPASTTSIFETLNLANA